MSVQPADHVLMSAYRDGDESAFKKLMDRYSEHMNAVALRYVRNTHVAEDMVQESVLKLLLNLDRYDGRTMKSWLGVIVANTCKDFLRHRGRCNAHSYDSDVSPVEEGDRFHAMMMGPSPNPVEETAVVEHGVLVREALSQVKPIFRDMVRSVYFRGESYRSLAERHNVPLGTVKSRINAGLREVRKLLPEDMVAA